MADENLQPRGYQQIAAATLATATGLTIPSTSGPGPRVAIIQAESGAIRWRDDGTNPTAAIGVLIPSGADFLYTGDLSAIKLIRVDATSIANVSYYT